MHRPPTHATSDLHYPNTATAAATIPQPDGITHETAHGSNPDHRSAAALHYPDTATGQMIGEFLDRSV